MRTRVKIRENLSYLRIGSLRQRVQQMREAEDMMITIAMSKTGGNIQHATEILGLPIRSLRRKIALRRADGE